MKRRNWTPVRAKVSPGREPWSAIRLDINDHHTPFPSLFILHEMRARGSHPLAATEITLPDVIPWQDSILQPPGAAEVRSPAESFIWTVVIKLNGNVVNETLAAASFGLVEGLRIGGYELGRYSRRKYDEVFRDCR